VDKRIHTKPVDPSQFIEHSTDLDDTYLLPFIGRATTAVAALQIRTGSGIECDPPLLRAASSESTGTRELASRRRHRKDSLRSDFTFTYVRLLARPWPLRKRQSGIDHLLREPPFS